MTDKVESHYAAGGDLARAIAESLRKAGKDIGALTTADLGTVDEFHIRGRLLHAPHFNTADGRARFVCRPVPPPSDAPLTLTTVRCEGQFNTIIYERTDSYRNHADRWTAMLHPADLAAHGLADGDTTTLVSAHGRMEGLTVRAFDLARGSVMAYFPEANVLTGTAVDPRSKTPAFKSTPVWFAVVQ